MAATGDSPCNNDCRKIEMMCTLSATAIVTTTRGAITEMVLKDCPAQVSAPIVMSTVTSATPSMQQPSAIERKLKQMMAVHSSKTRGSRKLKSLIIASRLDCS